MKLRECPFCGSVNVDVKAFPKMGGVRSQSLIEGMAFVECHKCKAQGPTGEKASHAIELWNDRSHFEYGSNWWTPRR